MTRHIYSYLYLCLLSLWLVMVSGAVHAESSRITLVSYNVQNLFDTEHDYGKNDWEFLPKSNPAKEAACEDLESAKRRHYCLRTDWTSTNLQIKLSQIEKAIKLVTGGTPPDILAVSEVENVRVIGMLAKKLGYSRFQMTESPDARGIDVAILYNETSQFKFVQKLEYKLQNPWPTRNLLEVVFELNGEKFSVFNNHWPSSAATLKVRLNIAKQVKAIALMRQKQLGHHILLTGDFNVKSSEFRTLLARVFYYVKNKADKIYDVHLLQRSKHRSIARRYNHVKGTYFYFRDRTWHLFDRFFIGPNMYDKKGLDVDLKSYRIGANSKISRKFFPNKNDFKNPKKGSAFEYIPWRYNHNKSSRRSVGYSDHYPIMVDLVAY